jgi:hypothetical protein
VSLSTAKVIFLSIDLVAELSIVARLSIFSLLSWGLFSSSSLPRCRECPSWSLSPAIRAWPALTEVSLLISIVSSLTWRAA